MTKIVDQIINKIFLTGRSVRWALQRPIVQDFLGENLGITLDIGCGSGMFALEYLPTHSKRVYGIDVNEKFLKYLQKYQKQNTVFMWANAEELPFTNELFDAVLCTEVLEHFKNDKKAINEIIRVLKKNGYLILSTPHPPAAYPDKCHLREGYTLDDIKSLLQGFKVITYEYCMYGFTMALLKFRWYFRQRLHFSPPILPVVYVEKFVKCGTPFDIIVKAQKI